MTKIDTERKKELDKKAKIFTFLIILSFIFSIICYIYWPAIVTKIIAVTVCILGFGWISKFIFIDIIYCTIKDTLYKKELKRQKENDEEECVYWY